MSFPHFGPAAAFVAALGAFPSPANASTQAAAPGSGEVWVLSLEHDAEAHRAGLEDLALWRRAQDAHGFEQRLALIRADQASRAAGVAGFAASLDVEVLAEGWLSPSLTVWVEDDAELAALRQHAAVRAVHRGGQRGPNQAQANAAHNLPAAHQLSVGGGPAIEGSGVTVAVLDSGMDLDTGGIGRPHAAFFADANVSAAGPGIGGSRVLSSEFSGVWGSCPVGGEDETGHGTRMAAILAGADWSIQPDTADGAAPDAWLRNFKITDCGSPNASTFSMENALNDAVALSDVRVVNLSYDGTSSPGYFFNQTMDAAEQAGVFVVVSAGNSGAAQNFMHGKFGGLAVGASFSAQAEPYEFPGFQTSAIGPLPDGRSYPNMLAVGEKITTAALDNETGTLDSYGSSGAAALTSGTAALMFQARPSLGALGAKALILDNLAPVVAGDADASGLGFLDSLAAVEAAIDGDVVEGAIASGFEVRYSATAPANQEFSATLTWGRENTSLGEADDLDLELRLADGTPVASSTAVLDNVERVTQTFSQITAVQVVVRMPAATSGPVVDYALAFDGASSAGQAFVADDFSAPSPAIDLASPQGVPAAGAYARFFVKGSGLEQVTGVSVGGQPAAFTYEAPARLRVSVPAGTAPGIQTVQVDAPGGSDTATLVVGVDAPDLNTYVNFVDKVFWQIDGTPASGFGLLMSDSASPTFIPGVIDIDIGNQTASLFLVGLGNLDGFGGAEGFVGGGNALPLGTELYFQAVVFDLSTLSLIPSNVEESIKAIHFGW